MTAKWTRSSTAILASHPTPDRRFARAIKDSIEAMLIVAAPATHNRATRRAIGMWGSIWRWDMNATEETRRTYVPRYIRRNFKFAIEAKPTRKRRKIEARILRISARKGINQ
jgi:hypothetical protein